MGYSEFIWFALDICLAGPNKLWILVNGTSLPTIRSPCCCVFPIGRTTFMPSTARSVRNPPCDRSKLLWSTSLRKYSSCFLRLVRSAFVDPGPGWYSAQSRSSKKGRCPLKASTFCKPTNANLSKQSYSRLCKKATC